MSLERRFQMKGLAIILILPFAAHAQLVLSTGGCSTGSPISSGSVYDFGQVAAGAAKDVVFFVCNPGNSSVTVTTIAIAGGGFSVTGAPATYVDAPNNTPPQLQFTVRFSGSTPALYNATLEVNTISVTLLATVVPAPSISVSSTCTINGPQIDFGSVQIGTTGPCTVSVLNPYAQPLTISSITLTGRGFQIMGLPALPVALASGQATAFAIQLAPVCGTTAYSGALTVGTQTFALTGTGSAPPLPQPVFTFDSAIFASEQQPNISMSLPTSYPCAVSGYLNLAFTPAMTVVTDDPSIFFMAGSVRSLPFSVTPNTTQISIAGQSSAAFQTGTTTGAITFTVTANGLEISGNPSTTINIPPAVIEIASATASNQTLGQLNIEIIGFDNTYTAGVMSFAFFDTSGKPIGSTAINADFRSQFQTYFTTPTGGSPSGSTFLMNVSFPITGAQAQVGSVQATLTNSAGQAQTGTLTFQ